MIADVTTPIQITVGRLVLARVMSRLYAACLIVPLMVTGVHGLNGQIAKVIVEWRQDIVLVPALILHPRMAGGAVKEMLKNIMIASWIIVQVSISQDKNFIILR